MSSKDLSLFIAIGLGIMLIVNRIGGGEVIVSALFLLFGLLFFLKYWKHRKDEE